MKTLWFKQKYINSILNKTKTNTIRLLSNKLPNINDICLCSVGPRSAFCSIKIINKEQINFNDLSDEKQKELLIIYNLDYQSKFINLEFELWQTKLD